ncbi:MAG: N-glycosylase/DNA lyase [Synergistetes bacterium]|nr:N-glycosylase/DNA lyase [Synergistota bacterium]MCX8128437.1 N-glycosylase/DNA lyase [Synergistota bacterium]MDW8193142.1 N-glycosylase/DNA lyase [Synergistota bacterium]
MKKIEIIELKHLHWKLFPEIEDKLNSFRKVWFEENDERLWEELVFCLLTPQSRAETCWKAVESLKSKELILNGNEKEILSELKGIRFKTKKAYYIIEARKSFNYSGKLKIKEILASCETPFKMREWLTKNVKGIGYKEASHFLRNIGLGDNLAILDRHILSFMLDMKLIERITLSLSKKKYLEIEEVLRNFSQKIDIPLVHLDFVLWYLKTGRIFK